MAKLLLINQGTVPTLRIEDAAGNGIGCTMTDLTPAMTVEDTLECLVNAVHTLKAVLPQYKQP